MTNFRLTLEYDGTGFEGWQIQPRGRRTVQGSLEEALARVTGQRLRVVGSGRTDAGVHARGQVASVRVESRFDAPGLQRALNGVLPPDVAVVDAALAPDDFHARRSACAKLYGYRIWNGPGRSPLRARFNHWLPSALDLEAMRQAARACRGRHDFAAFQASGSEVETSVRSIARLEIAGESRGEIEWGKMPDRAQYSLFVLAVTFTWLMGLMGFARSGIRQHWHVWEVMRDTSEFAATPALGYAANMISVCVVIFLAMVALIFWLGGLAERAATKPQPAGGG